MCRRLVTRPDIMKIIRRTKDYGIRSLDLMIMRSICGVLVMLGLSVMANQVLIGVQQATLDKFALDNLVQSASVITSFICLSTLVALFLIVRLYRNIVISQFQSMLFSCALRRNSLICIIVDSQLNVIYLDDNAQNVLFATEDRKFDPNLTIDKLFEHGKIDGYNKQSFLRALENGSSFSVKHTLALGKNGKNALTPVETKLEPLSRPKNVFLIKSYEIN